MFVKKLIVDILGYKSKLHKTAWHNSVGIYVVVYTGIANVAILYSSIFRYTYLFKTIKYILCKLCVIFRLRIVHPDLNARNITVIAVPVK